MKLRATFMALALFGALLWPTGSTAQEDMSFFDGQKLKALSEADKRTDTDHYRSGDFFKSGMFHGYVIGVVDAFNGYTFCIPSGTTTAQLVNLVDKFIKGNTEQLGTHGAVLIIQALSPTYPCKKK